MSEADRFTGKFWIPDGVDPEFIEHVEQMAEEQYGLARALTVEGDDDVFDDRFSASAIARRELYLRYSPGGRNIFQEAGREVRLEEGQTLLEVGYGDGIFLKSLAPHTKGKLIGVERARNHAEELELITEIKEGSPDVEVELLEMDARCLDFEDNSMDYVVMMFVLYHSDWRKLLAEAYRVLKPGGKLIAATRSPGNQGRLWDFADRIAHRLRQVTEERGVIDWHGNKIDYTGIYPPVNFYSQFPVDTAEMVLPTIFETVPPTFYQPRDALNGFEPRRQFGELHIEGNEGWLDYLTALNTLKDSFWNEDWNGPRLRRQNVPQGDDWRKAVEEIVLPEFNQEVAEKGYFTEYVKQAYFVCRKRLEDEETKNPKTKQ